jgi:hypothetical protein
MKASRRRRWTDAVTVLVDLSLYSPSPFRTLDLFLGYALYESVLTGFTSKHLESGHDSWPSIRAY